jgi:hypothetical protein
MHGGSSFPELFSNEILAVKRSKLQVHDLSDLSGWQNPHPASANRAERRNCEHEGFIQFRVLSETNTARSGKSQRDGLLLARSLGVSLPNPVTFPAQIPGILSGFFDSAWFRKFTLFGHLHSPFLRVVSAFRC